MLVWFLLINSIIPFQSTGLLIEDCFYRSILVDVKCSYTPRTQPQSSVQVRLNWHIFCCQDDWVEKWIISKAFYFCGTVAKNLYFTIHKPSIWIVLFAFPSKSWCGKTCQLRHWMLIFVLDTPGAYCPVWKCAMFNPDWNNGMFINRLGWSVQVNRVLGVLNLLYPNSVWTLSHACHSIWKCSSINCWQQQNSSFYDT